MTPEQRLREEQQWHEAMLSIVHAKERGEITDAEADRQIAAALAIYGEHPHLRLCEEYQERKRLKRLPDGRRILECSRCKRTIARPILRDGRIKVEVCLRSKLRPVEDKPRYIEDVGGKCPHCGIGQALSEYEDFHSILGHESYEAMMEAEGFPLVILRELSAIESYIRSRHFHTKMVVRQAEASLRR